MQNTDKIPNLSGIVNRDADYIEKKNGLDYLPWNICLQLMREHAPGWYPERMETKGCLLHTESMVSGGYVSVRWVYSTREDFIAGPPVDLPVMDFKMKSLPVEKITSRDVSDTIRRCIVKAAAETFGLGIELWEKDAPKPTPKKRTTKKPTPKNDPEPTEKVDPKEVEFIQACKGASDLDTLNAVRDGAKEHYEGSANVHKTVVRAYGARKKELEG